VLGERHPGFGGREVIHLGFRSQRRDLSPPAAGPFFFFAQVRTESQGIRIRNLGLRVPLAHRFDRVRTGRLAQSIPCG
jgi:hypothetical protein